MKQLMKSRDVLLKNVQGWGGVGCIMKGWVGWGAL